MREKLSVLIPAFNEEENIADCIESIGTLADELLVLDNFSTDRTAEIAHSMNAKVHQRRFDDYAQNKNAGIDLLNGDWILIVDADERLTAEGREEIKNVVAQKDRCEAYSIPRETYFCKRKVRCWSTGSVVRLFQRGKARYSPDRKVHEELQVEGRVGRLKQPMKHFTFRSFEQYMPKVQSFTSMNAQQLFEQGERASLIDFVIFPPSRFLKTYLLRLGFLDGIPGLQIAWLSAYSTFLKYSKLRDLQKK